MSGWVEALAPAKVNLWLDVLARSADGYHELDTGLLALELADVVAARGTERAGVRLELGGPWASPDVPADARNLAVRAALAYLERSGATGGVELRLEKRIPSRAGLGGGSADAAAALVACEAALGVALGEADARELLAGLGSDCVFFRAASGTGYGRCTGRGEVVEALPPPPSGWTAVLLVPDVGASTAAVYARLGPRLCASGDRSTVHAGLLRLDEPAARDALSNGLEPAALEAVPELARWRELLDRADAKHFRLCGSGSSFFGLFREPEDASRCQTVLIESARASGLTPRLVCATRPAGHAASLRRT